jgi:hypothetical protein
MEPKYVVKPKHFFRELEDMKGDWVAMRSAYGDWGEIAHYLIGMVVSKAAIVENDRDANLLITSDISDRIATGLYPFLTRGRGPVEMSRAVTSWILMSQTVAKPTGDFDLLSVGDLLPTEMRELSATKLAAISGVDIVESILEEEEVRRKREFQICPI